MNTATDLLAVLRRHYLPDNRPPAGIFAPEIESPCGKRRADALWMPTTWSGSKELIGHEIKVTRSDVLAELADPTKADAWAKYCGRWWLVVLSPALVDGLDVPETWGIMAPPSGRRTRSMTIVREAPKLTPVETGPGFRRVAAWLMYRQGTELATLQQQKRYAEQARDRALAEADRLRTSGVGRSGDQFSQKVGRIVRAVEHGKQQLGMWRDVDEATIVAAILDHLQVTDAAEHARYDLDRMLRAADELIEPMQQTRRAIEKIQSARPVVLPPAVTA